jgi:hypothetical protein
MLDFPVSVARDPILVVLVVALTVVVVVEEGVVGYYM